MSIEPTCDYCGLVDKGRCKTFEASEECPHAPVEGKVPIIQSGPLAGLTRQKYGAIYADPAWTFATRSNKGKGRSPEQHYDCMTLAEIKAMPVAELAAKDCVLFMWVIDTHLEMGLDVIREWGFKYKTRAFEWTKLQKNIADYPVEDRTFWWTSRSSWVEGSGPEPTTNRACWPPVAVRSESTPMSAGRSSNRAGSTAANRIAYAPTSSVWWLDPTASSSAARHGPVGT